MSVSASEATTAARGDGSTIANSRGTGLGGWTKPLRGSSSLDETLGAMDLAAALGAASERDADEVQELVVRLKKMVPVL
ncbi:MULTISPECIES: hypothetical protein [Sorangium]|uniref:hypothetical protein n=1 Tax=Sorangium TaxID=39643 RepID=UPI003D9C54CC